MTKPKSAEKDAALAAAFNAPNYEDGVVAVPEQRDRIAAATAETIVGVPETSDDELVQDFIQWLNDKAEESNTDSMAMLAQALREAEDATTIAQALREPATASSKDVLDRPFLAYGFTIHAGQFEESEVPFFASIEAKFQEIDDRVILNTSGFKVLAVLRKLEAIGQWPIPLAFAGKTTKRGHTVVSLKYMGTE